MSQQGTAVRTEILFLDMLNNKFYRMPLKTREEVDSFWTWYREIKAKRQEKAKR